MVEIVEIPKEEPKKEEPKVEAKVEPKIEPKVEKKETLLTKKEEPGVVPEKYEPWTLPEGLTLDEKVATEVNTMFKEAGLTQASGQKMVDFYSAKLLETAQAPLKAYKDQQDAWIKETKEDKDIGSILPKVKETVSRALDSLGDPTLANKFREAMDMTGVGNNPAFIKAFYKLAQQVTEGKTVIGSGPSKLGQIAPGTGPKTVASAMYPNLP